MENQICTKQLIQLISVDWLLGKQTKSDYIGRNAK